MIPALLEHVQTHGGERASLRIIALLLLLGGSPVINHLIQALFDYPDHQQRLLYTFLLLGNEAEKMLLDVFRDTNTPPLLRSEVAGILGVLRGEQEEVVEVATTLGEYGLWAGRTVSRTNVLQPARLAVSLRALGGLLVSGDWDVDRLQELRRSSKEGSAARELYDILLGWRYTPRIMALEDELQAERDERERLMKEFKKELLLRMAHIQELEHDLDQVRAEHEARVEELQEAAQERQSLRENLRGATQEQRRLEQELQGLAVERNRLQAQNEQWREYCARLKREIDQLRGDAV
jgi:hypothetical protein